MDTSEDVDRENPDLSAEDECMSPWDEDTYLDDDYMSLDHEEHAPKRHTKRFRLDCVRPSQLVFPKSQYEGYVHLDEPVPELVAIWTLEEGSKRHATYEEECKVFTLSDFSIYRPDRGDWPNEFVPLHRLNVAYGDDKLLFDGVISFGGVRRYVQRVPFSKVTIEGYGDDDHDISEICIQSVAGVNQDVWYSLGKPAGEYQVYHDAFLWIAEFAKHFLDYLSGHKSVHFHNLRHDFHEWLRDRYAPGPGLDEWLAKYHGRDFRQAFVAYCGFLWKEAYAIDKDAQHHPIWAEADPMQLDAIKEEPITEDKTVVTSYVFECFKHLYFRDHLKQQEFTDPEVMRIYQKRKATMEFTTMTNEFNDSRRVRQMHKHSSVDKIETGSVIAVRRDETSDWKDESNIWYAYVQDIKAYHRRGHRQQSLDVIWLYRPGETILSKGKYPWEKELFFSDHCNCKDAELLISDVLHTVDIEWFGRNPDTPATFFVRQKYCTDDGACSFKDLRRSDFVCSCGKPKSNFVDVRDKFKIGDSILVKIGGALEPCILVNHRTESREVSVRRLTRLKGILSSAKPNELGWTDDIITKKAASIIRKCYIRTYTWKERDNGHIPPPYCRCGAGDCWYISARVTYDREGQSGVLQGLEQGTRLPFNEGFNPLDPIRPPLPGLDFCCGGGSFGRGLEEFGAIDMKYAVDNNKSAAHTYLANKRGEGAKIFWGSVNVLLTLLLQGLITDNIARIGDILAIIAGTPCPGFSLAQPNKQSSESKRNSSLAASVVAFFDFYRPQYGIIENVPAMASDIAEQNVFAQILCALVGMGYQTQQFVLDAWSSGEPQSRSRLFIVVSAPGLEPLNNPPLTHAHPAKLRARKLGVGINGRPFGERRFEAAYPFDSVQVRDAITDLPNIDDGHVQVCIQYPDHRPCHMGKILGRSLMATIPTVPYGMNFVKARRKGIMATFRSDQWPWNTKDRKEPNANYYARVRPDGLFPTVTTRISPASHKYGPCLHPDQPRILTLMETRRAQGIPDDVVLVGSFTAQQKLVGNGVAYGNSLALGISMREAWLASCEHDRSYTA